MKKLNYLFAFILTLCGLSLANFSFGQISITIEITTDSWGEEVYWELVPNGNSCGTGTIFAGGNTGELTCADGGTPLQSTTGSPYADLTTIVEGPFLLTPGTPYDIVNIDDYGDGGNLFEVKDGPTVIGSFLSTGNGNTWTFIPGLGDDIGVVDPCFYTLQTNPPTLVDSSVLFYYSQTPEGQAFNDTLFFGAQVSNFGLNPAVDAKLYTVVSGAGTYSDSSAAATIPAGSTDFLEITTSYFIPSAQGTHNMDIRAGMPVLDQNTGNDALPAGELGRTTFDVTDSVYARDNDNLNGGDAWWYGAGTDYRIGCVYEVKVADVSTSISYWVPTNTTAGIVVKLAIWDASVNNVLELAGSDYYTITANDLGAWISLPFMTGTVLDGNNNAALTAGWYVTGLETQGSDTYFSVGGATYCAPLTVLVDPLLQDTWFYNTQGAPHLRMNMFSATCGTFNGSLGAVVDESVPGANDGSATVIATGGTTPYTYNWSSGGNAATEAPLSGGTYTCTITDANGCTEVVTAIVNITGCAGFSVSAGTIVLESAAGANDGSAEVNVTGGAAPITFLWSPGGQTTNPAVGLGANTYTCTITDDIGCTEVVVMTVNVVGIHEATLNAAVSIFPNPSNGVFTVEFTRAIGDDYNLEIINMLGQGVYNENFAINGSFTKHLDLNSLQKGVYFLNVSNSAGKATYKLIVE